MKISVVVPIYNENSIIESSVQSFAEYMKDHFEDYEIIFSDDGSTDGCGDAVTEYSKKDPHVILSRYEKNRGKGCAVRTGVLKSTGDIVMFTDCDIAYGLDVIKDVYDYFYAHTDVSVLVGSRNLRDDGYEGYTFLRKIASKLYIKVLCIYAGFNLSDSQCGMKAFVGDDGRKIFSMCETDGFAFDFEVLLTAKHLGMKTAETPVKIINHRASTVHVFSDSFKMLKDLTKIKNRVKNKFKKS